MVINEQVAAKILASVGIKPDADQAISLAADLDRIGHAFFTARAFLRGSRGRGITKIGRAVRAQLSGNLYGFWVDAAQRLPGASYDAGRYEGPFIVFLQAYCDALATFIEKQPHHLPRNTLEKVGRTLRKPGAPINWHSVMVDLRQIARSDSKARECLRLIPSPIEWKPWRRSLPKNPIERS